MEFSLLIGILVGSILVHENNAQQSSTTTVNPVAEDLIKQLLGTAATTTTTSQGVNYDSIFTSPTPISVTLSTPPQQSAANPLSSNPTKIENNACECVNHYLCDNGVINTDGHGIFEVKVGASNDCKKRYYICCTASNITQTERMIPIAPADSKCGVRNQQPLFYKVSGNDIDEAEFAEFPWMVIVLRKEEDEDEDFTYRCGGSLIHPRVVLTAAHCVYRTSDFKYKIRAGEWDTTHNEEMLKYQDRDVETVIFHPEFYPAAGFNDIALLILRNPVNITKHVNTICLPQQNQAIDVQECVATGWGRDTPEGADRSLLKKVDLPIVPREACQDALKKTKVRSTLSLNESFICAGGKAGQDTCKGDGGGPLACRVPESLDRYYQAGIVAWGVLCGQANVPGVYANVPFFVDWIKEQLVPYNIDSSYYTI